MSTSRSNFLIDLAALEKAVSLSRVGSAPGHMVDPGVGVLRRGAAITGLVMLENFVRSRTEEVLVELQNSSLRYRDFPDRFRSRATIEALPHIEKFAGMLRRDGRDYESEIIDQAARIASLATHNFQFTKFFVGDYTGNLSIARTKDLLNIFQVRDCWTSMHLFSIEVGFGVPSVRAVLETILRNRHRSAHVAGFTPAAGDVVELPFNLRLVGICIDAALSASVEAALRRWPTWISKDFDWRAELEIYSIVPAGSKFRLVKRQARRATRVVHSPSDAKSALPGKAPGITRLIVEQGTDGRPREWDIV